MAGGGFVFFYATCVKAMHLGFPKFLKETMLLFVRSTTFLLCDVQEKFRTVIDQMYGEPKWQAAKKT